MKLLKSCPTGLLLIIDPPGVGKTHALGAVVFAQILQAKKVSLTAPANLAVTKAAVHIIKNYLQDESKWVAFRAWSEEVEHDWYEVLIARIFLQC